MEKQSLLYSGKAKSLYETDLSNRLWCEFRNDTSAFDGTKVAQLDRKGMVNNYVNAKVMEALEKAGIETHFEERVTDNASLVKRLDMIPVECVVRNVSAGSLCRRLGVEAGLDLNPPTFEFFLKNDPLHDPMVNDSLILTFGWAKQDEIDQMKKLTMQVNAVLKQMFADAGMILVDYKLEFGRYEGRIVLGDEFTPDGCRLWDSKTREVLDKDRFRKDMGGVVEAYEEVARRLNIALPESLPA